MENYISDHDKLGVLETYNGKKYTFYARSIMELIRLKLEIYGKASYQEEGKFRLIDAEDVKAAIEEIQKNGIYFQDAVDMKVSSFPRPFLEDSTPVYTDIENAYVQEGIMGPVVEFYGKRKVVPELGRYVGQVLNGSPRGVFDILDYEHHEELMPIEKRIEMAQKSMEGARECDTYFRKKRLNELIALRDSGKGFDIELLKAYHNQACDIIELQEQESGAILTLNQYKKQRG